MRQKQCHLSHLAQYLYFMSDKWYFETTHSSYINLQYLRFKQWHCWRFKYPVMWHYVTEWQVLKSLEGLQCLHLQGQAAQRLFFNSHVTSAAVLIKPWILRCRISCAHVPYCWADCRQELVMNTNITTPNLNWLVYLHKDYLNNIFVKM